MSEIHPETRKLHPVETALLVLKGAWGAAYILKIPCSPANSILEECQDGMV
jgi:hypothetical protein